MARLQRVEFWSTKQYAAFGFQSEGQGTGTSPVMPKRLAYQPFFAFTQPYVIFKGLGQSGGTTPPPPSGGLFLVDGGPGVTELFVTTGTLSGGGLSYLLNPMSRRTV